MLQYIILYFSCIHEIKEIQTFMLELNKNCIHRLEIIDAKYKNFKIELEDIKWLCKIKSDKYYNAVYEFKESLLIDLLNASKWDCNYYPKNSTNNNRRKKKYLLT